jgi:hypothetical protein
MTDISSHPSQSPRFRRERRAGAWLRDFNASAALHRFSIAGHFSGDAGLEQLGDVLGM